MNDLYADVGFKSINHWGEQLCGDQVDIQQTENSSVIVVADGLGSGVKASILSTLTARIISTMVAAGLPLEDCVATIAATLPVDSARGVAYSTFTIIHLIDNERVELIQYDNPTVVMLRAGKRFDYPKRKMEIDGKEIYHTELMLEENDIFVAMTDGCPHAGIGMAYDFGWRVEGIAEFMEVLVKETYAARTLSTVLVDECARLYEGRPRDDTTACVVRVRRRSQVNLLFGPPFSREDDQKMLSLFFGNEGKHIVCGGTTSTMAANYLGKPLEVTLDYERPDVPPIALIEGVDLATEGIITINKVLDYARDCLSGNEHYDEWFEARDAASRICQMLFEEATDINFFVGRAINPAHQNPDLPINFSIKMNLVRDLSEALKKMGKRITVAYY